MVDAPRYIASPRLRMVSATAGLLNADLASRAALAEALEAIVPDNWPPELYDRPAMEWAQRQLADPAEQGWSFWYLLHTAETGQDELIGLCGFKGRPDAQGSVEIGYSMLDQFRNLGYASEAVARLVEWAFGHARVSEVSAETLPYLRQSIRVLEKNGFGFAGPGSEHGVVRYAVSRRSLR
ncbi:MAG: GNAT family N-acetyltransferase [Xanthomonadales bacterium]|nr:GNAT family N-acetyltransferase [Xanthomonadales bacterium]